MIYTLKVTYNTEVMKITKLTKVHRANPKSDHTQIWSRKFGQNYLTITHKIYT